MNQLSAEKLEVLKSINGGKNIFITGSAGTGKSYLLKIIKSQFRDIHITASTGIAAVQIGGMTVHSWAGIGIGTSPISEILKYIHSGKASFLRRKVRKAKLLAIDEISMISGKTFDLLNEVLKDIRDNNLPFGGIQIIALGDFLQLPPISFDNEKDFCFESNAWKEADFKIFYLKEIFRQKDQDFANLLTRMRIGKLNKSDIEILRSRIISDDSTDIKPTTIVTHNKQVDLINQNALSKLKFPEMIYHIKEEGDENKVSFLKKNCLAAEKLVLKLGAQVMMLKNTLYKDNIINGSLGIIVDFSEKKLPIVKFANGITREIECEEWITEELNQITQAMEVRAKIVQIPLMLAWAVTVHKSQGMTLDKIECDLTQAFEEGQIYVAISRVKSLEGLYLKSFNPKYIRVNQKVTEFYKKLI